MSEEDKQNEHDEQLMRDHWLSDLAPIVNSDDNLSLYNLFFCYIRIALQSLIMCMNLEFGICAAIFSK